MNSTSWTSSWSSLWRIIYWEKLAWNLMLTDNVVPPNCPNWNFPYGKINHWMVPTFYWLLLKLTTFKLAVRGRGKYILPKENAMFRHVSKKYISWMVFFSARQRAYFLARSSLLTGPWIGNKKYESHLHEFTYKKIVWNWRLEIAWKIGYQ
jgi:hypothetical protein